MTLKKEVQKWLTRSLNDPIAKLLMKNSNLTKIQTETFLIDILAEKMTEKRIIYEEKAKLRLLKSGVSRGAFNRTLRQARKNVTKSIYTIILLGYLGIFESPKLEPYLELANKLHTYTEMYKELWKEREGKREHMTMLRIIRNELENGLRELIEPNSTSEKV